MTAQAIASACSTPALPQAAVLDIDYGEWTGLTPDEVGAHTGDLLALWRTQPHKLCGSLAARASMLCASGRMPAWSRLLHGTTGRRLCSFTPGCLPATGSDCTGPVQQPLLAHSAADSDAERLRVAERGLHHRLHQRCLPFAWGLVSGVDCLRWFVEAPGFPNR